MQYTLLSLPHLPQIKCFLYATKRYEKQTDFCLLFISEATLWFHISLCLSIHLSNRLTIRPSVFVWNVFLGNVIYFAYIQEKFLKIALTNEHLFYFLIVCLSIIALLLMTYSLLPCYYDNAWTKFKCM